MKKKELTITSIILGIILAVVFGAANAYLGLRVGMTVSASIPAAVISMGIIRIIMKRDSILENNMVQTIGSAGESVAAGAIFTLPVLFMWADENGSGFPTYIEITLIVLAGSILGVLFMVPLRKMLIVKEKDKLPYPEGEACAKVLLTGEHDVNNLEQTKDNATAPKSGVVFVGLLVSAVYKFLADGLKIFPSEIHYESTKYKGSALGIDVLPALVGVGFICGTKIASYMLAGGILSWLVLMPVISFFGNTMIMYPGTIPVNQMDSWTLWSNYIRYIGAGAVAAAGVISLIKTFPSIASAFRDSIRGLRNEKSNQREISLNNESNRKNRDMPFAIVIVGAIAVTIAIWLIPTIPVNLAGAFIISVLGFFFATVSSRMVGLVGSSNNPVSGMAIATLLISTLIIKISGNTGLNGMISAIAIGSIICIIAAIAGDTSQDLKTGYILGATPVKQQIGELIGVTISSIAIAGVLYLLSSAWGYGSAELPAPQATLMKLVVEGVMNGNLPWNLIMAGAGIAIAVEILGIPSLPMAV
ncbi:MAG: OPT family oligopeptide transporter, partial [Eubacterium sp.]